MDRTQKTEIVNMCMVFDKNLVLVEDKIHSEWGGLTFPGGHVEKEESLSDAVIREVFEETGLTIESPALCGTKDWVNEDGSRYLVLFYKTDKFSGELKSSDEGKVFWIPRKDLENYPLANDFLDMVRIFESNNLSEFYYTKVSGQWEMQLL